MTPPAETAAAAVATAAATDKATAAATATGEVAKPDWTNRRRIIFCALRHDMTAFWANLAGAFGLAIVGKFDGWIATFSLCVMFTISAHSVLIIGSYVFQASWEGAKFMDFLTSIKPGKEPA